MSYPGKITSLSGAYRLGVIDEECQGWVITKWGKLFGLYLDDTTPNLESTWLPKAITKYGALGLKVIVGVPPGEPEKHYSDHPCVIAAYERYIYGMGDEQSGPIPPKAWGPVPRGFKAFICQWRYPGTLGKVAPTRAQRLRLLASVLLRRPRIVFLY